MLSNRLIGYNRSINRSLSKSIINFQRCNSSRKIEPEDDKESKELTSKKKNEINNFKIKQTTSSAAPAPIDRNLGIGKLMKKDNKPYIPKLKHERLSYEYPGLPNEDDFNKQSNNRKTVTRWSRYFPKIITAVAVLWGAYTVKVWIYKPEVGSDSKELLDTNEFHKFVITHKEEIDENHYLIEIVPKFSHWQYSYYTNYENKSIWNGDKIWSVDVKQPEIMVVRAYTPLPLYFMKSEYTRSGDKKPLLRVVNNDEGDYDKQGVMCLYVKRYNDGEVSKYITNKKVGDELELRGPNIEYKFPYHPLKKYHERPIFRDLPSKVESEYLVDKIKKINKIPDFDNLDFYAGGTGIAPILQVLLSRNPYRGFVNIHYSSREQGELKPLGRFLFFLEKLDRIKMQYHYDSDPKSKLSSKDVPAPELSNYLSPIRLEDKASELTPEESLKLKLDILNSDKDSTGSNIDISERVPRYADAIEQARVTSQVPKKAASLSIVCGPDGYIDYVAGPKNNAINEQGPIKGLLGDKKWDNSNVYKL